MEYTKPVVLAQNSKEQSFAVGCPIDATNYCSLATCRECERTQ